MNPMATLPPTIDLLTAHGSSTVKHGQIYLIIGPMFAEKTSTMLLTIRRYTVAKKRCVSIKHSADVRYDHKSDLGEKTIMTHSGEVVKQGDIILGATLAEIVDRTNWDDYDVVFIFEGQFWPDLVECSLRLSKMGKPIWIDCLNGSYEHKPFDQISKIIPYAILCPKTAVCMGCFGNDGLLSCRKSDEKELIVSGGADKYATYCIKCAPTYGKQSEQSGASHHPRSD